MRYNANTAKETKRNIANILRVSSSLWSTEKKEHKRRESTSVRCRELLFHHDSVRIDNVQREEKNAVVYDFRWWTAVLVK